MFSPPKNDFYSFLFDLENILTINLDKQNSTLRNL